MEGTTPYVVLGNHGQPLARELHATGPLSEPEALTVAAEIADALGYLHGLGYAYQMVEPGSIYRHPESRGIVLGWPAYCCALGSETADRRVYVKAYAAPEVSTAATFEPATDIYGIGAVLLFALTGRRTSALADRKSTRLNSSHSSVSRMPSSA